MKLTKFTHACFTLEKDGLTLVFDPGNWSGNLALLRPVAAIVLTHEHADHFDIALLRRIVDKNPEAIVIAPNEMTAKLTEFSIKSVTSGDHLTIGPFDLDFFGGQHASIHPDLDSVANIGVLVNTSFYYPGDSFAYPDATIKALALPVVAPWLKISEPIDFMLRVKPEFAFPVHDHIASDDGKLLADRIIGGFAEKNAIHYQRINGSIDL